MPEFKEQIQDLATFDSAPWRMEAALVPQWLERV